MRLLIHCVNSSKSKFVNESTCLKGVINFEKLVKSPTVWSNGIMSEELLNDESIGKTDAYFHTL